MKKTYIHKKRNRAWRRHQINRMKSRAMQVAKRIFPDVIHADNAAERQKYLSKYRDDFVKHNYNHLATCSCFGCGNPRRHFNEKTLSERRFEDKAKSYFDF